MSVCFSDFNDIQDNGTSYKYPCDKCGRMYKWKENLNRHKRKECGQEPKYLCTLCPYRAKHKSHLKSHVLFKHQPLNASDV